MQYLRSDGKRASDGLQAFVWFFKQFYALFQQALLVNLQPQKRPKKNF
jgi:hypothetical protein